MKRILLFTLMMGTVPLQAAEKASDSGVPQTLLLAAGAVVLPILGYRAGVYMRRKADELLLEAIEKENPKRAAFCLDLLGCDPNRLSSPYDMYGLPIHKAVERNNPTMVDLLLKRGAHDSYDKEGIPAILKCSREHSYNPYILLALLEAYKAKKHLPYNYSDNAHKKLDNLYEEITNNFYDKFTRDNKAQQQGMPFNPPFYVIPLRFMGTPMDN